MYFHLDKKNNNQIIINYHYTDYAFYPNENYKNDIKYTFLSKTPNISSTYLSSNFKSVNSSLFH